MNEAELVRAGLGRMLDLEPAPRRDEPWRFYRPAAWGATAGEVHVASEADVRVARCGLTIGAETWYSTELPVTCAECITG